MSFNRFSDTTVAGKRVFIRADLNVPQDDQCKITDDTRIRASVPCIRQALDAGARVMVTSHLGRPKEGAWTKEDSLAPIASRLSQLLRTEVPLVRDWVDGGAWLKALEPGHVVLLENCRFNAGEKENSDDLAKKMAALCDVYVNDAFGTAHRAEASTHGIAKYAPVACAGPLLAAELDALGKALAHPARPLVAIVAGSKVSSKLSVLTHLAAKVDTLFAPPDFVQPIEGLALPALEKMVEFCVWGCQWSGLLGGKPTGQTEVDQRRETETETPRLQHGPPSSCCVLASARSLASRRGGREEGEGERGPRPLGGGG